MDQAVRASLAPNPKDRPATCLEFFKLLTARLSADFNAPETSSPAGSERRAWVRHPLGVGTYAAVDTAVHSGGGGDTEELWPLVVRDVSAGGIGVLLARRFELGTELPIELTTGRT